MAQMKAGIRVVRGPDWRSKSQDGGLGFTGTIVYVPKVGSSDDKVTVIWDSGRELRYRAGTDGKYDLRVFDNGPAGIKQDHITCDACSEEPIIGMRWKCAECHDYDLCTKCYMNGKHDVAHRFVRIDTEKSSALAVPPRNLTRPAKAKGIFPDAIVMRGPHWKWKNDDGGEGEQGTVVSIKTWNSNFYRAGAEVRWDMTKKSGTYRLGGEGSLDLIYIQEATWGQYYPDHLPLVDVVSPGEVNLKRGDKVRVALDRQSFKQLQDNDLYGNWNDGMDQCINELGTITNLLFAGRTVRVQYEDSQSWNVNRVALTRIHRFSPGEAVQILDSYNQVKDLQQGHGGWNDEMKDTLGRNGRIIRIDKDGDMRVQVGSRNWIFSPVCLMPVEDLKVADKVPAVAVQDEEEDDEDSDEEDMERDVNLVADAIAQLFAAMLRGVPGAAPGEVTVVQAAAQGDLSTVQSLVTASPEKVNMKVENKTALQLASYEGHSQIVTFLLDNKADINLVDEEGDTALHYSAFGTEEETLKILLSRGANKNAQNKKGQAALHITVGKASVECTSLLISKGASLAVKDNDGDTPMHDCILQRDNQPALMQVVLGAKNADFRVRNRRSFNILQWATLKDNRDAADLIIDKNKGLVNDKMDQDFTALHIAAANDHVEIASSLIRTGGADVNPADKNKRTPLHMAVTQGHKRMVDLLISVCCDVNARDEAGNTALHLAQIANALPAQLAKLLGVRRQDDEAGIQIICALVEAGADLNLKNNKDDTPLDLCVDAGTKQFLKMIAQKAKAGSLAKTQKGVVLPVHWEQMMGTDTLKMVTLIPSSGLTQKEYQSVSSKFRKTLPQAQIIKMERIQNKFLWEHYFLKRRQMEGMYGQGCANELDLYHGTNPEHVETICKDNLDFRLAGERVGTLFGKGTYFALEAKYSDGYAAPDHKRHKFMFVCKVLAGKVTAGNPNYKRPPPVNPADSHSKLYDCCVDNVRSPRIYCVFDQNQYYPEYVIEYQ